MDDAIPVNWFSVEIINTKGKRTYYTLLRAEPENP
jgi:hypothetical protein